jgi:hypothetical protein
MKKANSVSDLSLYAALFLDIAAWDEDLRNSLTMDYLWIERLVKTRGMAFIMIDMPEGGKVVDQAFQEGRLWAGLLPNSFGRVLNRRREFLSGLMSRVFDDDGFLLKDADAKAVYFLRQVLYLAKKVRKECSDAAVLAEVEEFKKVDCGLRSPSLNWLGDALDFPERPLHFRDSFRTRGDAISDRDRVPIRLLSYVQQVADIVISRYPALDWRVIKPRHGPGAVADGGSGVDKYHFPTWPAKLERVFPFSYFGQSREDLHLTEEIVYPSVQEPPVRLFAVPKTLKAPRMIASEPVAHQFIQLGLMKWFRDNMPKPLQLSIDFKNQTSSQEACLEASKTWNQLATVDLSAASDRLSCWVVERVFRSNPSILEALHACRTRWLTNASGVGEPFHMTLRKYAPMGNGTTFPVQSIVYTIIAIACAIFEHGGTVSYSRVMREARNVRVFGDDIILPSSAVTSLVAALDHFDLKVNRKKTFAVGPFRESCGMDAYKGVDVTPLYVRDLLLGNTADSVVSWLDVCKNAARKGLPTLAQHMEHQIPQELRSLLPRSQGSLSCLTRWSYFPGTVEGGKRRYNKRFHRSEVLGLTVENRDVRRTRESHGNLLQYFVENPPPDVIWASGFTVRRRSLLKKRWVPLT